jgi:hypothetical protein
MTATEAGALTTAHNRSERLIRDFRLGQNYPNPFNPTTRITYSIGERSRVQLAVFDLLGREVRSLVNDWRDAGEHSISFDAGALASGVYFYSLRSGEHLESKRMIVLR